MSLNVPLRSISILLLHELLTRIAYFAVYYDPETSIVPLNQLHAEGSAAYNVLCVHGWFSTPIWFYFVWVLQVSSAVAIGLKKQGQWKALMMSFVLYVSLTLRNTYLSYILDRYYTVFLFLMSLVEFNKASVVPKVLYSLQILWIYLDASYGKYEDPENGWGFSPAAGTIPALDTYTRHTLVAQILYTLLGSSGLALLTPVVLWVEIAVPPVTVLCFWIGLKKGANVGVVIMIALHIGIGLCMKNAGSLSLLASVVWLPFFTTKNTAKKKTNSTAAKNTAKTKSANHPSIIITISMISASALFVVGSYYTSFVIPPSTCLSSQPASKSPLPSIFHNRWNVFTSSETHVTWEIAPGEFDDGSVLDIWSGKPVSWDMPIGGAASTSTARGGRWRSFPYLIYYNEEIVESTPAEIMNQAQQNLWNYLCRERKGLKRFKFFMLQADTLENMQFGNTRKRLIIDWQCD